jgi:sigma-E factor negative regulatory protein RseC
MSSEKQISHYGIVNKVTKEHISVSIVSESACASCHAKGYCNVSEIQEKIVEVPNTGDNEHQVGESVIVVLKRSLGTKAILYGYFFPFVLMMITLLTTMSITDNEGIAGLSALLVLVPYYFGLYLLREKIKSKFEFKIENYAPNTNVQLNKL